MEPILRIVDSKYVNATTTWDSTTQHVITVPAKKRWYLQYGRINRDVSSTLDISLRDTANSYFQLIATAAAGTSGVNFPEPKDSRVYILDPGDDVIFVFGTAQSTAAYIHMRALEVDLDWT